MTMLFLAPMLALMSIMLSRLAQVADDNPLLMLLVVVLGFPVVTSVLVSVIRKVATTTSIKPQQILYAASLVLTVLTVFVAGGQLPGFGATPVETVGLWLAWATVNAGIAAFWYEFLLKRIPVLAPPPEPEFL